MDILTVIQEYGIYIGFSVVVAGVIEALKSAFPKVANSHAGLRVLPFLPIVLGAFAGLLLPVESLKMQILAGCALGTVSASVYKIVTQTLASKVKLAAKLRK